MTFDISTHTPRERRDFRGLQIFSAKSTISTHTPRERRDKGNTRLIYSRKIFQLTRLVRGVTL